MARYRGPATKIARKFGEAIFGYDKSFDKKNYPPGQHGLTKKRKQQKEYGIQLQEKQKAKYTYGVLERQFRNLFAKAHQKEGVTGTLLLQMLESRLDNVVYRLGMSPTRRAARQLVTHGHILVNGKPLNIPSCLLRTGDKITLRERSKDLAMVKECLASKGKPYAWLDWNMNAMEGTFITVPEREQIPENIREQLIVELYSK